MTLNSPRTDSDWRFLCLLACVGMTLACGDDRDQVSSAPDMMVPTGDSTMPADAVVRADSTVAVDAMIDASVTDMMTEILDAWVMADAEPLLDSAIDVDALVMDGEADAFAADTQVIDAGPQLPSGPIPPPEGADPTPEDMDFSWNGIGNAYLSNTIPRRNLNWSAYPRYGIAQILPYSNSEQCVCFDAACAICSQDSCSTVTCTYDLNPSHTLTKYYVELRSLEDDTLAVTFEVNISADPPIVYTDIEDVLNRLERIPIEYWYGLKIITKFGRGIQFLHSSYFNGAAAYGSRSYIDTQTASLPTLLHELGHTLEQYTRLGDEPVLEPQSNILNPIWRQAIRADDVRTSGYGNNNEWEDMAEFSRLYAMAIIESRLSELQTLSPERYRIWERVLLNGRLILP